jgi:hypothetical protein
MSSLVFGIDSIRVESQRAAFIPFSSLLIPFCFRHDGGACTAEEEIESCLSTSGSTLWSKTDCTVALPRILPRFAMTCDSCAQRSSVCTWMHAQQDTQPKNTQVRSGQVKSGQGQSVGLVQSTQQAT